MDARKFRELEFDALRDEILKTKERIFILAGIGVLSVPAGFGLSSVFKSKIPFLPLPVLIAAVMFLYLCLQTSIMRAGRYIRFFVEDPIRKASGDPELGWEHYLSFDRELKGRAFRRYIEVDETTREPDRRLPDRLQTTYFYVVLSIYYLIATWAAYDAALDEWGLAWARAVAIAYLLALAVLIGFVRSVHETVNQTGSAVMRFFPHRRQKVLLALDVGASHTRVGAVRRTVDGDEKIAGLADPATKPPEIRSAQALKDLLKESASALRADGTNKPLAPDAVVLAIAGPVDHEAAGRVVNWEEDSEITSFGMASERLPQERIHVVNDLQAGAHGLIELLRENRVDDIDCLDREDCDPKLSNRNMVLAVPGTGLGAAGILGSSGDRGGPGPVVVPTEAGHALVPLVTEEMRPVLQWIRSHRKIPHPTWEDLVSGRGLSDIHAALAEEETGTATHLPAEAIAAAARPDGEDVASRSVDLYYRIAGRFCQSLALMFSATGGVFLGGTSTIENETLIRRSGFVEEFRDNPTHGERLKDIRLFLVKDDLLNLHGALAVAAGKTGGRFAP